MTASEAKPTATESHNAPRRRTRIRILGLRACFWAPGLATLNARLVGVGLADLRGAKGFGFDEASWIPTALNMATMFSGVFVVFVNAVARPTPDSPSSRRHLYARFGDVAVCSGLLAHALADGDCWPVVGNVLFADNDLRFDDAAQTPDHLWNRGLCGGHRVREQYRHLAGRVVHRTSFLGVDLLDCRGRNASDVFSASISEFREGRPPVRFRAGADSLTSALRSLSFTARSTKASGSTG